MGREASCKGLLDWKIIAAIFAVLIVISSSLVTDVGKGFFSNLTTWVEEGLKSSPIGGLFSMPTRSMEEINLFLYPESITLKPEQAVNISSATTKILNFNGKIVVDFQNQSLGFQELSGLIMEQKLEKTIIDSIKITNIKFESMKMNVKSGKWNIITDNGTIEISNFLGKAIIENESIEFKGNVSKIVRH